MQGADTPRTLLCADLFNPLNYQYDTDNHDDRYEAAIIVCDHLFYFTSFRRYFILSNHFVKGYK